MASNFSGYFDFQISPLEKFYIIEHRPTKLSTLYEGAMVLAKEAQHWIAEEKYQPVMTDKG